MTQTSDLGELLALRQQLSVDPSFSQADIASVLGEAVDQFLIPYRTPPFIRIAEAARSPLKVIPNEKPGDGRHAPQNKPKAPASKK